MTNDDLGYLLRRSHDEREMADKAEDTAARFSHHRLAGEYAARALKLMDMGQPDLTNERSAPG